MSFIESNDLSVGGHIGFSILGTKVIDISGTDVDFQSLNIQTTGTGNFEGGISGGNFN